MPRPPPDVPGSALARRGNGWLETLPVELLCGIDPVVSLLAAELLEPHPPKREESLLQAATLNPINEMATKCGQTADLRHTHMMTRPHATNTSN
jgi:hypothetical protein